MAFMYRFTKCLLEKLYHLAFQLHGMLVQSLHSCLYKLANLTGNNGSAFVFSSLSVAETKHFP